MMRFRRRALALVLCVAAFGAAAAPRCERVALAEWHLDPGRDLPVTDGSVNGRDAAILIDTGAAASVVTDAAVRRLGLETRSTPERMRGIGGDAPVRVAHLDEIRVGAWSRNGLRVLAGGDRAIPGVDLVLGEDVLHTLDVELDYAARTVRIFDPAECGDAWPAGWEASANVLPLERDDAALRTTLLVNGREAIAIVDSAAARSMVSLEFAYRVGVAPDAPGVAPGGCVAGFAGEALPSWIGRFDSVQLGRETIRGATLAFADFTLVPDAPLLRAPALSFSRRGPDVLLGNDFLRTHRVLAARGQGRLYSAYTRGTVFPPIAAAPCAARSQAEVAMQRAAWDTSRSSKRPLSKEEQ